jgi:type I restriction enzyme, S subunit
LKHVHLPYATSEEKRTGLQNGDLLVSITADIGIIGYVTDSVPKPAYINQHISLIRFNSQKVSSKFVAYSLASEYTQRIFKGSTDQGAKAGLNLNAIRALKFTCPSAV